MPKRIAHDWTGALGGGYRCSVCREYLTTKNNKSSCKGLPLRYDNELKVKPFDAIVSIVNTESDYGAFTTVAV